MLPTQFILWILCTLSLARGSTTDQTPDQIVDSLSAALNASLGPGEPTTLTTATMGSKMALLMEKVIPLGSMILKNINPKPESEEYKALAKLEQQTRSFWEEVEDDIKFMNLILPQKIFAPFRAVVNPPLDFMMNMSHRLTDPDEYKDSNFISDFSKPCWNKMDSPKMILKFMMDYLVTPCGNSVSQKEAAIMSEQREYLMSVLDRLRVKTREDKDVENPGRFMSEFSKIYSQIDKKHLNEELDAYHNIYSTYRQAMDIFFERLRVVGNIEKVKNEHGCLLYELVREANFGIDMILMFVIELNRDLIELTYTAGFCTSIANNDTPQLAEQFSEGIINDVELITTHVASYIKNSFTSAWPTAYNIVLMENIKKRAEKPGKYEDINMKTALSEARKDFKRTGDMDFVYGFLVIKPETDDYDLFYEGLGDYCSARYNENRNYGFDTIIQRIPYNLSLALEDIRIVGQIFQLQDSSQGFETIIKREMEKLYLEPSLPQIAATLKSFLGPDLISEEMFHGWAISREWSYRCPTPEFRLSPYTYRKESSIMVFNFTKDGGYFRQCVDFRFFFFV